MRHQIRAYGLLTTTQINAIAGGKTTDIDQWMRRKRDPCPQPVGKIGYYNMYDEEEFLEWARRNNRLKDDAMETLQAIPVMPQK